MVINYILNVKLFNKYIFLYKNNDNLGTNI